MELYLAFIMSFSPAWSLDRLLDRNILFSIICEASLLTATCASFVVAAIAAREPSFVEPGMVDVLESLVDAPVRPMNLRF
jgi:hypothetical protein